MCHEYIGFYNYKGRQGYTGIDKSYRGNENAQEM